MKSRYNTIDLVAVISELKHVVGMRLIQIYDIDNKTYLFKLSRHEEKFTLLVESGIRIHGTNYEWPKNPAPLGFTMKLRKHLKNKRLEAIYQLGIDRVVIMQFGINEAAYYVIVELYDRGNVVLTDHEYVILNILRPRTVGNEDVRLVVREKYPLELARQPEPPLDVEKLQEILEKAEVGVSLKKHLNPHFVYGSSLLEHALLSIGLPSNCRIGKEFDISNISQLKLGLEQAQEIMNKVAETQSSGYIIQKVEIAPGDKEIATFTEFHPYLFLQHEKRSYMEFPSFNKAVDHFFSNVEGQKIDIKTLQKEKEAMKKLENIKKDHENRIESLQVKQSEDQRKAQFIEMNLQLVDNAILVIQSAIANQISWKDIWNLIQEAQKQGDSVALAIKQLKLDTNHFTMLLHDPYISNDDDSQVNRTKPRMVDIDLDLSAYANARKYYDNKKHAAKKEQKTIESSMKAYKSAEKKAKQTLKEVAVTSTIIKVRKTFWFEKFLWFISSENYIVIAGRDVQQNELIVKRYMKPGDIYVHADLHGASSVVIKNPTGKAVPPKTLNEAGTMAVCYSTAWDNKVVTSAWWVYHHQVSKTAPSGEYLVAGSFMIRGKKNYLPPSYLVVGFGFLFRLDEDSIERHLEERKVKSDDDDAESLNTSPEVNLENEILDECSSNDEFDSSNEAGDNEQVGDDNDKTEGTGKVSNELDDNEAETNEPAYFPDTIVSLPNVSKECKENMKNETASSGDTQSVIIHVGHRKQKNIKSVKAQAKILEDTKKEKVKEEDGAQQLHKRGQKGKLKKIKEKYKNQDDEERELRMKILASAGNKNNTESGKKKKDKKGSEIKKNQIPKKQSEKKTVEEIKSNNENMKSGAIGKIVSVENATIIDCNAQTVEDNFSTTAEALEKSDDEIDINDDVKQNEDEKILNSLTGCPVSDDTLLFAVPVCAPYAAMQNYKYKVKLIPGSGRRGKASKTALNFFLNDKTITSREKDLLRSTKEQDICRNIPGKVKLSVPRLNRKK